MKSDLHILHGWLFGHAPQESVHGHYDARGAEPALGAVRLGDALLHRVDPGGDTADPLHCRHSQPVHGADGREARISREVTAGNAKECWFNNTYNMCLMVKPYLN